LHKRECGVLDFVFGRRREDAELPATRFLFWNTNRRPLAPLIAELAEIHSVDLMILAECEIRPAEVLLALNRNSTSFHFHPGLCPRIAIYARFSPEFLRPVFESERVSIRSLALPARESLLLASAHLPSKLHWSDEDQAFECVELARQIGAEERKAGHRRTILVGDLNMNPFERGMVSAAGLGSVMSRQVASRLTRTVQGREYGFFYNPMWAHLGDARGDTAGSYFHDNGAHVNYYWNVFDQVLLRPELAGRFDPNQLQIVKSVGSASLIHANGRPDHVNWSDHLPLVFEVKF
jgi:hypothetical protein